MGVSTAMILWTLWLCKTNQASRGIAYWLPTDGDLRDFVHTKLNPMIAQNPDAFHDARIASGADNVGLKFMWNTPTYWRGIKSKSAVKSISADALIFDEFDECDPAQVTQARERTSASDVKLIRELSTPTIPDFGINKRFLETDQRTVMFQCQACAHWLSLEESFPQCMMRHKNGEWYRGCTKCKAVLDLSKFQWVSKQHLNKIHGYQISQLYSPWTILADLMHEYEITEFPGHFQNHKLGLPYIGATDRVTKEQVLALCDPLSPMRHQSQTPTVAGIDVGKVLHCVVMSPTRPSRILFIGELLSFEEIDGVISRYGVKGLVIDAMPETHKVRELTDKYKAKAWACWYNESKDPTAWDDENNKVSAPRTETLDSCTKEIHDSKLILPQRDRVVEEFATHCANLIKTVETDDETGDKRYVYRRVGPDHYRHAYNYAKIAASRFKNSGAVTAWRK